ncbi:hypothetical protein Tco_1038193 [Tanacetum coccineum]
MSEEDQTADAATLPKFDMPSYESEMTAKDVKVLALRHGIPLDLYPVALTKGWTMDKLSDDMIGLYEQYFEFSGIRVPFSAFLFALIKHFRVQYSQLCALSKQGHWFSFEKRTGKSAGGQIFRETFSGLKGWKRRFFFLDRRAIPDAMAWRHHDSDVNDPVPEGGFSVSDVFRPVFKDTEGNVITMSEYLRFPFLSGATISQGPALTSQDQIAQHTARPLPSDQIVAIRERKAKAAAKKRERKKQGGDGGEGSRPATKRQKTVARRDGSAASEATSSLKPIRTLNPNNPSVVAETAESREDRSPRGSADHSVHNYDTHHGDGGTGNLRLGTFGDPPERAITHVDTKVVQLTPSPQNAFRSSNTTQPASHLRTVQRGNTEAGESSRRGPVHVPDWAIRHRCRLDTPMWCRELMVHLATPATQEESNALNNTTALERAWFSLARGALAQTDILERFENLQANFDELAESHAECGDLVGKLVQARLDVQHSSGLYNSLSDRFKAFRSAHEGCARRLEASKNRNRELSQVNKDQALRIKELEDTLAKKDSALVYAERINTERAQEREKLVSQLGRAEKEKFDCVRKLLPTVVERLLQSHEYKESLSEPFNLAIQAGWGKGLAEERSEENLLKLMGRMEGFDIYDDKKMKVEYDKLFEKRYPYVEKISQGFRHSVSDLLKIYPDSPPYGRAPLNNPSSGKAPSTSAPRGA